MIHDDRHKAETNEHARPMKKTYAMRHNGRSVHWWATKDDQERLKRISASCEMVKGIRPSAATIIRVALEHFDHEVAAEVKRGR